MLDTDQDGVISDEEFAARDMREVRAIAMKEHMFERLDASADGYLTSDEFPPRRMASLDADGDGEITLQRMTRSSSDAEDLGPGDIPADLGESGHVPARAGEGHHLDSYYCPQPVCGRPPTGREKIDAGSGEG